MVETLIFTRTQNTSFHNAKKKKKRDIIEKLKKYVYTVHNSKDNIKKEPALPSMYESNTLV